MTRSSLSAIALFAFLLFFSCTGSENNLSEQDGPSVKLPTKDEIEEFADAHSVDTTGDVALVPDTITAGTPQTLPDQTETVEQIPENIEPVIPPVLPDLDISNYDSYTSIIPPVLPPSDISTTDSTVQSDTDTEIIPIIKPTSTPTPYIPTPSPTPIPIVAQELCDGLDNDQDKLIDEGCFGCCPDGTFSCCPNSKTGDFDCNGEATMAEASVPLIIAYGATTMKNNIKCADVNKDNRVNMNDTVEIIKLINSGGGAAATSTVPTTTTTMKLPVDGISETGGVE